MKVESGLGAGLVGLNIWVGDDGSYEAMAVGRGGLRGPGRGSSRESLGTGEMKGKMEGPRCLDWDVSGDRKSILTAAVWGEPSVPILGFPLS